MHLKVKKNRGVALILVLMITAVMAVIMLYMSGQGQNNARLAGIIKQHTNAKLNVETAQAELVFSFMTSPFSIVGPRGDFQGEPVSNYFTDNLQGRVNELSELNVKVQDIGGLVSLVPFNERDFTRLLSVNGVEQTAILRILDRLNDWQDIDNLKRLEGAEKGDYKAPYLPRNTTIQITKELLYILDDEALYKKIEPHVALYGESYINRQLMPKSLYSAFGISRADTAEGVGYPSGRFRIEINIDKDVSITKRFTLLRGQDSFRPFFIIDDELIFE